MLSAGDVSRLKTMSGWKPFAGSGEQLLLKVTSGPRKTAAGVMALAHYVARAQGEGEHARLELFDEMGEVVAVEDLKATIKGWDLLRNQENMRPGARDLVGEDNGVSLLPERERFWRNQAYHFVWSQTAEGTGLSETELASRMREATREFVFTEFAEREHQVLWGLHLDQPGRPHIHLIVKARSNGRKKGQLRLTPQILEDMRARLAKQARILELPVHSERREDRPDLLQSILDGHEPLRRNLPRVAYDKNTALAERVPYWLGEEGKAWQERKRERAAILLQGQNLSRADRARFEDAQRPMAKKITPAAHIPDAYHQLLERFAEVYSHPEAALGSYFKMVRGDGKTARHKALAIWYLKHQPLAFGSLVSGAEQNIPGAVQAARACQSLPSVNWANTPADFDRLVKDITTINDNSRLERDRANILVGLGRLRRRLRLENVSSAHRELVRNRMTAIRAFVPSQVQERDKPQHALQRVVDFIRPKRKPTR